MWERGALPRNADGVSPGWIDRQERFNPNVVNPIGERMGRCEPDETSAGPPFFDEDGVVL